MKIKRKLNPGQPGTKKLVEKYGDDLVCVRYRYDSTKKRRYKTVELIIENVPWQQGKNPAMNKIMNFRIDFGEIQLRRLVKSAGGKWNQEKKLWELTYKQVLELNLADRIVK